MDLSREYVHSITTLDLLALSFKSKFAKSPVFTPEGSRCDLILDLQTSTQKETMRWIDIWAAMVAADASK